MAETPEFSFPIDITSLAASGRTYTFEAAADSRERVARRLGVRDVATLTARFDLTPRAGAMVHVTGTVRASLTQTCVVTLVPVPALLVEEVDATFTTVAPKVIAANPNADIEQLVALGEADPPEEATDGTIDLGELAVVQIALGLDPYPRAPGAAFSWEGMGEEKGEKPQLSGPFAVLATLKTKDQS